jgi:hypothetical protein
MTFARPTTAAEFAIGDDIIGVFNASVSFGGSYRTEAPDPTLLGALSSARVQGVPVGSASGANSGGNDLNFPNNTAVSRVLKGLADLELKRGDYGVFVRAKAWQDYALTGDNHPYGNYPNGFTLGAGLSDNGFDPDAKFANAQFVDYYAFGKFDVGGDRTMDLKLGRQFLNWGVARMVGGGINIINPLDIPGAQRPGAVAEESRLPVGMLSATLQNSKLWGGEAFLQYEWRPNVYPGCGTFYSTANYLPSGCNYVSVLPVAGGGGNDSTQLASGRYAHRGAEANASDFGQFGLTLRLSSQNMATDFRFYAMNLNSGVPSIRVTNANVSGTPGNYGTLTQPIISRLTDPNGAQYGLVYAERIQICGISFESKLSPTTKVFGELTYRPNQPINLNASDIIVAFLQRSPTSVLNLAKGVNALPAGASFDGFDRFAVTNLSFGTTEVFAKFMGAERVLLAAEVGMSNINGLPDADHLRYGRSDDYGGAAYTGGLVCVASSVTCAQNGYVTANSWGYRLRAAVTYANTMVGATVTPSLFFSQDVQGYSYDGSFAEGRRILRPGVRFEWGKRYFAEAQYNLIMGGLYNTLSDRDTFTVHAGLNL